MAATKQDQIIFLKGKERALKILFSEANFGYLALGYNDDNGFMNETDLDTSNGFVEITDPTYKRVKLTPQNDVIEDEDTGKVTITLVADIDVDNIINYTDVNQLAIVDSSSSTDANTIFYCAATFPTFSKSEQTSLSFELDMQL